MMYTPGVGPEQLAMLELEMDELLSQAARRMQRSPEGRQFLEEAARHWEDVGLTPPWGRKNPHDG